MLARDLILGALLIAAKLGRWIIRLDGDHVELDAPSIAALGNGLAKMIELTAKVSDISIINRYHCDVNFGVIRGCNRPMPSIDAPRIKHIVNRVGGKCGQKLRQCLNGGMQRPTDPGDFVDTYLLPGLNNLIGLGPYNVVSSNATLPPLVVPEQMEAAKWFGGWKGTGSKARLSLPEPYATLAIAGIAAYTIAATNEAAIIVAPDSTIGSTYLALRKLSAPVLAKPTISRAARAKLVDAPKLTQLLVAAVASGGARGIRIVEMRATGNRVEVMDAAPSSAVATYSLFASSLGEAGKRAILGMLTSSFLNQLAQAIKRSIDEAVNDAMDVLSVLARNVMEVALGAKTPSEAMHELARESYMREPTYAKVLTPRALDEIHSALRILWEWR